MSTPTLPRSLQPDSWLLDSEPLKAGSTRPVTDDVLLAAHELAMRQRATQFERYSPKCNRAIAKAWEEA